MNHLARLLLLLLAALVLGLPAQAQQRRVALLIGNANYAVGALRNPPNDVRVMDESLRALGFQTQVVLNANQNTMKRAVRDFGARAQGADIAFLYYSGHGTQASGENYLIPVQASIDKESDYEVEAVSANAVLRQIAGARPKAAVVVLDACRDNPLAAVAKTGTKGLGRMEAPTGTLIAFATAPNTTASDEGHYARVLGAQLRKPGVELLDAFRNTTAEVLRLSRGKQEPRVSEVSITERVYLAGSAGTGTQVASIQPEPVVPGLDLGDLQLQSAQQAERERREQAVLARMRADFDKVAGFTGAAEFQAKAWERFLAAWSEDKVPGEVGRGLRGQALQRLSQARAAASAPSPVADPSSGPTETVTVNGVSFKMVAIPAGSFLMGSPASEPGRDSDEDQHRVSVKAFQLGQTEVTQGLWQAVMGDNPSRFKDCGKTCPVEQVSWEDAQAFVQKLNQLTGKNFRLPTEAEWEYAARASTTTPFSTGQTITAEQANFDGNYTYNGSAKGVYRQKTTAAGSFDANGLGLHDMHGNVWEWVQDCYGPYSSAPSDGSAVDPSSCSQRVLRGGSWNVITQWLRAAIRYRSSPDFRGGVAGFRIARTAS